MELTKKVIMKEEKMGSAGMYAVAFFWTALGIIGLICLLKGGDFSAGSIIGFVIVALIFFGAYKFIVYTVKSQKRIKELRQVPWHYNMFECIGTDTDTSVGDGIENFYVDFADADGKEYRITQNKLRGKIKAGDKLILVVTPDDDSKTANFYRGVWYFSSSEHTINPGNHDFIYDANQVPLKG